MVSIVDNTISLKIVLLDNPTQNLLVKIPDFGHCLTVRKELRVFRLINTEKMRHWFHLWAAGFYAKKNQRLPKMTALHNQGGSAAASQPPPALARRPVILAYRACHQRILFLVSFARDFVYLRN